MEIHDNNLIKSKIMKKTYKNHKYFLLWIAIIICSVTILSCSQWDDYKKYTKDGEIVYTGKFDTAIIYPGKERVRLYGLLVADPKIVKCKIYWNNKADSIEYDIPLERDNNIFDQTFAVNEGVKSFTIYTFDALGNSSVPVNAIGSSYGARYRNKIANRRIKSISYDEDKTVIIWDAVDNSTGPVQTEVVYKSVNGDTLVTTPITESTTILKGLKYETETFRYRTVFKPEPISIDTFCTIYTERPTPTFSEQELDKSLFKANPLNLPGDAPANGGSGGIAAMWDERPNGYGNSNFTDIGSGQNAPQMVTFDVGVSAKLTKLKLWVFVEGYGAFVFSTMKRYEIWGSSNPSATGELDGSWSLMASDTINKPSGLPGNTENAEDAAAAAAGFTVVLDPNAPKVRYLRIRCLQNFEGYNQNNNKAFFSVGELKVFGLLPE
jgi:hypothetical protein